MNANYDYKKLQELISRGGDIMLEAQNGDSEWGANPQGDMLQVFDDYHLWKIAVHDFFWKYHFDIEAAYFFEADSVPMLKGGLAYSHVQSEKSQKLLKNIRSETKSKLQFIRDFVAKNPPNLPNEKVYFDEAKETLKIGAEEIELDHKTNAFLIIWALFNNPDRWHDKWFFSEISEHIDPSAKYDDRKFYNSLYRLDQKLKQHQITDFFQLLTTSTVQINPRYTI